MPIRAKKMCAGAGCRQVVPGGVRHCDRCAARFAESERVRKAEYETRRPSATERGYNDPAWRRCSRLFLEAHPTCVGFGPTEGTCGARATQSDHLVSPRVAPELKLSWKNLRALCASCHARRTATEQGFARPGPRASR